MHKLSVTSVGFLGTLILLTSPVFGQQGVGAKYGARNPATCPTIKEPAKGAPSAAQAAKYAQCAMEGEMNGSTLFLVQDVKVEVGGGIPLLQMPMIHRPGGADPNTTVYAIRGSYKKYQCTVISKVYPDAGKNCRVYDVPKATGNCYRTNFGEWSCKMDGDTDYGTAGQAPPK
jgi:hypothetical protein